jgi:NADH:ubiquinone reductase (H+-translocating)
MSIKNIVIVGGGFGGIYTYKTLRSLSLPRDVKLTLIDQKNHFLFTPLLPEVAMGGLDQHNVVEPLREIIQGRDTFVQGTLKQISETEKKIILEDGSEISFDVLILGLGAKTFFFNTPGAEEFSFTLKSLDDAVVLRNHTIDIFEEASRENNSQLKEKLLRFVIVGGGPTGVELAGEAADFMFSTLDKLHNNIHKKEIDIVLVNAAPKLVGMFQEKLQSYAQLALRKVGVRVLNGVMVTGVDAEGIVFKDGTRLDSKTVVWAAGVSPQSFVCETLRFDKGRVCVNESLQTKEHKNIFVVGDMSFIENPEAKIYPQTAQVAKQQGIHTAHNIKNLITDKNLLPFVYKEKGLLASLGRFDAIAQIKNFTFTGFFAWFLWRTIYLFNFASWKKRLRILSDWTLGFFTKRDTSRL